MTLGQRPYLHGERTLTFQEKCNFTVFYTYVAESVPDADILNIDGLTAEVELNAFRISCSLCKLVYERKSRKTRFIYF